MQYRIAAYVRVSTDEQAQVIEGSIDSQKYRLKTFVESKAEHSSKWGKIVDYYIDDGYSAKDTNRPAYKRMMNDIKASKINMIIVTDMSRLSRSMKDFCNLVEDMKFYQTSFLSLKEQFDTSTAAGEMMLFNIINLAQFERRQTSERVSINFHARALRGLFNGGGKTYGFDPDPINKGKLAVNPVEAKVVKEIFDLYLEHISLNKVAAILTDRKVPVKIHSFKNERHKRVGRWTIKPVYTILKNPIYIGTREINKKNKSKDQTYLKSWQRYQEIENALPAIIDKKVFNQVQKYLQENLTIEKHRTAKHTNRVFLLSGILRCAECGSPLIGHAAHGRSDIYRYYSHKQVSGEKISCTINRFQADLIEQAVVNQLDKAIQDSGYLESIKENIIRSLNTNTTDIVKQKRIHQKQLDQIEQDIENVFKVQISADSGSSAFHLAASKLTKLADQKKEISHKIDSLLVEEEQANNQNRIKKVLQNNLENYKRGFKKVSDIKKKKLIREFVDTLFINSQKVFMYTFFDENRNSVTAKLQKNRDLESSSKSLYFQSVKSFFDGVNLGVHDSFLGSRGLISGRGAGT